MSHTRQTSDASRHTRQKLLNFKCLSCLQSFRFVPIWNDKIELTHILSFILSEFSNLLDIKFETLHLHQGATSYDASRVASAQKPLVKSLKCPVKLVGFDFVETNLNFVKI